jgi:hypothetical protein
MRRGTIATLLLVTMHALLACSSTDNPPPAPPDDPVPNADECAGDPLNGYPLHEYSANLSLTGEKGVKVTLISADPAPPSTGDNVWTLEVTVNGEPADSATVSVTPSMPLHAHPANAPALITDLGDGTFRAEQMNFKMPGVWSTVVDVKAGDVTDFVRFSFCAE